VQHSVATRRGVHLEFVGVLDSFDSSILGFAVLQFSANSFVGLGKANLASNSVFIFNEELSFLVLMIVPRFAGDFRFDKLPNQQS